MDTLVLFARFLCGLIRDLWRAVRPGLEWLATFAAFAAAVVSAVAYPTIFFSVVGAAVGAAVVVVVWVLWRDDIDRHREMVGARLWHELRSSLWEQQ